jgi:hypothetical protein
VDAEQTTTMNAVVETVDPTSREFLLRGGGGEQSGAPLSMVVTPRVQRFNQSRPGDRATVRYRPALAAQAVAPFSRSSQPFEGGSASEPLLARLCNEELAEVTDDLLRYLSQQAVDANPVAARRRL